MLKFRFTLTYVETGEKTNFKTLKDIAKKIDIPYHQARSILLCDDKLYLHPKIEQLTKTYKIEKTI